MKKYLIIIGRNIADLEARVNAEIQKRYRPQGGVLIHGMTYAQAVYKE